jgi:glutathione S-transferase
MEHKGWRLYTYEQNPRAWKVLIAAQIAGIAIEVPRFVMNVDNLTDEYARMNPLRKVPVLQTPDGCVWESNAIARHVARQAGARLYGGTLHEAALIDQWLDFAANEIDLPVAAWTWPLLGIVDGAPEVTRTAQADVRHLLALLDAHLREREYLVGAAVSLADVVVACSLYRLFALVLDADFRRPFPHVTRWFVHCMALPAFVAVCGEMRLCGDAPSSAAPLGGTPLPALSLHRAGQHPPSAPAQPPPPGPPSSLGQVPVGQTSPTRTADPPPGSVALSRSEILPATSPSALTSARLPAAAEAEAEAEAETPHFSLAQWKTVFSGTDARSVAIPWLWRALRRSEFSVWLSRSPEYADVAAAQERLADVVRTVQPDLASLFCSLVVLGAGACTLYAVWIVPGAALPPAVAALRDRLGHSFALVDPHDVALRSLAEDVLVWEDQVDGRVFRDGRVLPAMT